ncbi:MAG: MFS transporter [Candidatus Hadarchaeaceae archaeon]
MAGTQKNGEFMSKKSFKLKRGVQIYYGWIIVVAAFLAMLVVGSKYIFGIFIQYLTLEFGWSATEISLAFSISFLFTTFLAYPVGKMCDRYGIKKVMAVGASLVCLGYF